MGGYEGKVMRESTCNMGSTDAIERYCGNIAMNQIESFPYWKR